MGQLKLYPQHPEDDGREDVEQLQIASRWYKSFFERMNGNTTLVRDLDDPADLSELYIMDHEKGELRRLFPPGEKVNLRDRDVAWDLYRRARDRELLIRGMGEDRLRVLDVGNDHMCHISDTVDAITQPPEPEEPPMWKQVLYTITLGLFFSETVENFREQKHLVTMSQKVNEQLKELRDQVRPKLKEEREEREQILKGWAEKDEQQKQRERNKGKEEAKARRDREVRMISEYSEEQQMLDKITEDRDSYLDVSAELRSYGDFLFRVQHIMGPNRVDPPFITEGPDKVYNPLYDLQFGKFSPDVAGHFKSYAYSDLEVGVLCLAASGTPQASSIFRAAQADRFGDQKFKQVILRNQNRFDLRNVVKDMFLGNKPNAGGKYDPMLREGRRVVNQAIGYYKSADLAPLHLGTLFVDSIRDCLAIFNSAPSLEGEAVAFGFLAGHLAEMVASRYRLDQTAKAQGLTEEDLQMARGAGEMAKIRVQGIKAQKQLMEAGAQNKALSPEKTKELLTRVHMMRMASMEHELAYMKTVRTDEYISNQSDMEDLAAAWQTQAFGSRSRDGQDIIKYGQDYAFGPSQLMMGLGEHFGRRKEMYKKVLNSPHIEELSKLSPAELAKHVVDAGKRGSEVDRVNQKIFQEWKKKENPGQELVRNKQKIQDAPGMNRNPM